MHGYCSCFVSRGIVTRPILSQEVVQSPGGVKISAALSIIHSMLSALPAMSPNSRAGSEDRIKVAVKGCQLERCAARHETLTTKDNAQIPGAHQILAAVVPDPEQRPN